MDTTTLNTIIAIAPTAVIGIATLVQSFRNGRKADKITKEVTPNGGNSLKDRSEQNSQQMDEFGKRLTNQERSLRKLNWVIGRFIVHAGRNDLGRSDLMEYEEGQLQKISPEEREEFSKEADEEAKSNKNFDEEGQL